MNYNTHCLIQLKPNDKNVKEWRANTLILEKDPENIPARLQIAINLLRMGELELAVDNLNEWRDVLIMSSSFGDEQKRIYQSFMGLEARYRVDLADSDDFFSRCNDGMSQLNLGFNALIRGEYEKGFRLFEERFTAYGQPHPIPLHLHVAPGQNLQDKSLYIRSEGGFGDVLMMARFIRDLHYKYKHIYLHVHDALYFLMEQTFKSIDNVKVVNDAMATMIKESYLGGAVPMLSLPRFCGVKEASANIGYSASYIGGWNKPKNNNRKKVIGINWAGNPDHETDFTRSIPTEMLTELFGYLPDYEFVSIHKGAFEGEITKFGIKEPIKDCETYYETYKELRKLDYFISVDTSTAHLAASMGMPGIVMLSKLPEWRWGLEEKTKWYPNIRLVRQSVLNDWSTVFKMVAAYVEEYFNPPKHELMNTGTVSVNMGQYGVQDDLPF
jgi:hypothetical protein